MPYLGSVPAVTALTSANIADGAVNSDEIATGAVDLAHLSASGTAGSGNFLRGDNSWQAASTDLTAIADGSVGSPSLANSGDNNTGVYWPGADQLGLTTAGAAGLLVDASGRVTTPLQPMFRAQRSGAVANVTGDGTVFTVPFNEEIGGDVGGNYNLATAVFTAPVAGYYLFSVCVPFSGLTSSHTNCAVSVVFSSATNLRMTYFNYAAVAAGGYVMVMNACVARLAASETAYVTMTASNGSKVVDLDYGNNSHFGGFLIG